MRLQSLSKVFISIIKSFRACSLTFVVHYKSTKIFKMAKTSPNKFQEKNVVTVYDLNNKNFKFEKNLFFSFFME